jgi:2-amino-4-hydroxy-6-hydroxymethyldihydropteridine diphosphokinase
MNAAVIEFGSNINPYENISKAKKLISGKNKISAESVLLETEPVGDKSQPFYVNCAVLVETEFNFNEFKKFLEEIEEKCGRIRTADKFAPRTMDLDIVVWNDKIIHKDYDDREYVRVNVSEVWQKKQ